jgi:hypothetical protein
LVVSFLFAQKDDAEFVPEYPLQIIQEEGLRGFYRGCITNLVRTTPAAAITFTSYEVISRNLGCMAAAFDNQAIGLHSSGINSPYKASKKIVESDLPFSGCLGKTSLETRPSLFNSTHFPLVASGRRSGLTPTMAVQRVRKIECHVMGVSPALLSSTNCSTVKPLPQSAVRLQN